MISPQLNSFILACLFVFCYSSKGIAQTDINEKHIQVSVRMMGHQILLNSGDSISLILVSKSEQHRYKLEFEKELLIRPEELVAQIESVVEQSHIATSYLVEVQTCNSGEVVYSYEIGNSVKNDLIPCINRLLPKACYRIYFTILEPNNTVQSFFTGPLSTGSKNTSLKWGEINIFSITSGIILLICLVFLWIYFQKKRSENSPNEDVIQLGAYEFNSKTMELFFKSEKIELSSKEADLLALLLKTSHSTVERDYLLKTIWGDEGNYIGRTLDVFISKLRKKLEEDASVKIINVRGVGYKLIF